MLYKFYIAAEEQPREYSIEKTSIPDPGHRSWVTQSPWNAAARRFSSDGDPATISARHDLADDRWVMQSPVPAAGNFADARHEHQKLCQEDGAILAMMPEVPRRRRSRITQSAPPRRSGAKRRCSRRPLVPLLREQSRNSVFDNDPSDFPFKLEKSNLNVRFQGSSCRVFRKSANSLSTTL